MKVSNPLQAILSKLAITLLVVLGMLHAGCKDDDDNPSPSTPAPVDINPGPCDGGLSLTSTDAMDGAKAIDICALEGADGSAFGLIEASYSRFNGSDGFNPLQVGIMDSFGPNNVPNAGEAMLVLSTGHARAITQPSTCGSSSCQVSGMGSVPSGIPIDIDGCTPAPSIYDDICLNLTLKAPASAKGFSIDHSLFSFEYPIMVCTPFNDQFLILMDPEASGSNNGNVAHDSSDIPMGVNSSFMYADGNASDLMQGTGFVAWGQAGVTGWLRTSVPVEGGAEFTLKIVIFDTGDPNLDSTVLLDNFRWLTETPVLETVAL